MLRAFLALAECLNLSEASDALGLTRQTVRRYIDTLEVQKGAPLFILDRNRYLLTPLGEASVAEARHIVSRTDRFCAPVAHSHLLDALTFFDEEGRLFRFEQHPITSISNKACPLLQRAFANWASAKMQLESDEMTSIRPYLVVYRRDQQGWRCVEIGDKSAYTRWFGWTWSKSAVGKLSFQDRAGLEFDRAVSEIYLEVYSHSAARLDHLYAHLPREEEQEPIPVTFQRLLLTCKLPDGTPVLAVLVAITGAVDIAALEPVDVPAISHAMDMNGE